MLNLILFGPPGSGKGTQSEKIIEKYGLIHLSTGDLLRSEIGRQTALGMEAKKLMDLGRLVPDEVVVAMISSMLDAHPEAKGYIFDGFPRTSSQAISLDKLLALKKMAITLVLALEVPEEELIRRLLQRGTTSGRSDDANEQIIRSRIQEYHHKTAPVAEHYDRLGKFKKVQGNDSVMTTFSLLSKEIDALI
ncbi:MAG: adenylate kinase [Chitinophagaceae bacterium]